MSDLPDPQMSAEDILAAATAASGYSPPDTGGKKDKGPSQATLLVEMAQEHYDLGCTADGEPYAVPKSGPLIVRQLRGGRQSLRAELAAAYYDATGSAASQTALADACLVLEGMAHHTEPVDLHLRVAEQHGQFLLDLGDATGRCVALGPGGWQLLDQPPVRFRRTALTGALPEPRPGGDFTDLWAALNVAPRYRPLVLAVLVAALMPTQPHVVVLLLGEQGTGKSTASGRLASILDPSPAQLRKPPRDADTWTTAAAGSWVVALDNLSAVPDWLSDALCRASTGDGDVRRRLYTDGDLHVIAFRRVVICNGIDMGALRGDLADRAVTLVLDRIRDTARQRDENMTAAWKAAHPTILAAVLDLAVKVLAALPSVQLAEHPRMADFARILAAVDQVNGTDGLATYLGLRDELAQDAATSDPVLAAIIENVVGEFLGTSADLLAVITPPDEKWRKPKDWPTARQLTGIVRRSAPTLRQLGWTVEEAEKDPRARALRWSLTPPEPRRSAEDARNTRDARSADESAGHSPYVAASVAASVSPDCERPASDDARTPPDTRSDARTSEHPLNCENVTDASVTSDASDGYTSPPSRVCTDCGQPLFLTTPGRTTCARCALARKESA